MVNKYIKYDYKVKHPINFYDIFKFLDAVYRFILKLSLKSKQSCEILPH